jgi:hypothetical protein
LYHSEKHGIDLAEDFLRYLLSVKVGMTGTAYPMWQTRALPILRYIAEHETERRLLSVSDIMDATGIEAKTIANELDRLVEGGFIAGTFQKMRLVAILALGSSRNLALPSVACLH